MGFKILAINPGSTSTKVALYDEERPSLDLTLRHTAEQIARYTNIIDQLGWRREMILTALSEHGFDIMQLSAVIGRGGLVRPIPAGVYEVNEAMRRDLTNATMEHASNLGGLLAAEIAAMAGVKAYIADPVVVDEMEDVARLSGHPDCPRKSIFHALNQKATARLHCDRIGIVYEKANLVVAHLGGGISVAAHKQRARRRRSLRPRAGGQPACGRIRRPLLLGALHAPRSPENAGRPRRARCAPGHQFHDAGLGAYRAGRRKSPARG